MLKNSSWIVLFQSLYAFFMCSQIADFKWNGPSIHLRTSTSFNPGAFEQVAIVGVRPLDS